MRTLMDLCFLCTKDFNCVAVDNRIVSQVEYLLPEITIVKLGIPLHICSVCEGGLYAFSKCKQFYVESSRRLEASIKGARGKDSSTQTCGTCSSPLDTDRTPDVPLHRNKSSANAQPPTHYISSPATHLQKASTSAIQQTQLQKSRMPSSSKLPPDTNSSNIDEIVIKQEQLEQTPQDQQLYDTVMQNILEAERMRNKRRESQREFNTEDEREEVWEASSADSDEETVEETNASCSNQKRTGRTENYDDLHNMSTSSTFKYAVVTFTDNSASEVPTKWLCEADNYCWWPNTKNVSPYIYKNTDPHTFGKWTKYDVTIEEYCETLETARRRAEEINDLGTEEIERGRAEKRKEKQQLTLSLENSNDSDHCRKRKRTSSPAPIFPIDAVLADNEAVILPLQMLTEESFSNYIDTQILSEKESDVPCNSRYSTTSPALSPRSKVIAKLSGTNEKNFTKNMNESQMLRNILQIVTEIKYEVTERKKWFGVQNRTDKNFGNIVNRLPVNTDEDFNNLEECLMEEGEIFVQYIKTIGGSSAKDNVHRILKTVFTNLFATGCSWLGLRQNRKMEGTRTIKLIQDLILNDKNIQSKEFEVITADWFRHATTRLKRQK